MDVTTMHGIQKKKKEKNITVLWTLNLSMEKIQENIKLPLNFEVLATLTILNMHFIKILTKLAVFLNEQKIHIHGV